MRIAQVVHQFLPRHLAGVEVYTKFLSQEMQKRHEVSIYCREDGFFDRPLHKVDEEYQGLPVRRVHFNLLDRERHLANRFLTQFRNPAIEESFARFLDDRQPDVVHVQHVFMLSAGIISVAQRRGLPVVVTLHDYWFLCHAIQLLRPNLACCSGPACGWKCTGCAPLPLPYPLRFLLTPVVAPLYLYRTAYMWRQLHMANLVTSPSSFLRDRFVANGFPSDRILLTDYGTADHWLARFEHQPSDRLRFGFIGSVMRHKGVHTLIEAFNQVTTTEAELHIFGDPGFAPDYYAEMQALARNPRIRFRGRFENDNVDSALAELDVLVVPSIWYENAPITIHEARLAGIPVIGSRIGGIPEFVDHEVSGMLFEAGNAFDLHVQMQRLIDEPQLLNRLRQGIRPVKTMEQDAREFESIYEGLLAGGEQ